MVQCPLAAGGGRGYRSSVVPSLAPDKAAFLPLAAAAAPRTQHMIGRCPASGASAVQCVGARPVQPPPSAASGGWAGWGGRGGWSGGPMPGPGPLRCPGGAARPTEGPA
jgi:hypothetical protein